MRKKRNLVLSQATAFIITSLSFIAALAWNEAFQNLFRSLFGKSSTIISQFVYAGMVTIVAALLVLYLKKV
jgi:hypothetical protein